MVPAQRAPRRSLCAGAHPPSRRVHLGDASSWRAEPGRRASVIGGLLVLPHASDNRRADRRSQALRRRVGGCRRAVGLESFPGMRLLGALVLLLSLTASPIAQSRTGVPTPDSVFGFEPGADYKLATYDQSIEYFKKLAAASKYIKLVEAGKTTQGRTMYFALISTPDNLAKIDRYREICAAAGASAGPDRRGGASSSRAKARRSSTSTAACIRPKSPARSTRRCSPTTCSARRHEPATQGDSRQRHPDAVADDQSRRPADGRRVVHEERRHAVRAVGTAAALSGVRRPRQQPRRLHAQHDRVARDRAHVAAVGAADHLRAPPVGPVPDAHLAAAVLRAGRHRRAVR